MKLTIIDNIISLGYQNLVEEVWGSSYFDWYFNSQISVKGDDDVNTGFTHRTFYTDNGKPVATTYYHLVYPILSYSYHQPNISGHNLYFFFLIHQIQILLFASLF